MLESPLNCSILKRAQDKGLVEIAVHNLREFTTNKHRKVDDYPFGGEAGMVMQVEPIDRCISTLKAERDYDEVIFTSPDGEIFDQPMANSMSLLNNIIILCGHYKGVDYRVREHLITKEISIGDYVLTGGELPAMVIIDCVSRFIPGVLGSAESAEDESFSDGLLEYPQYTRPAVFRDMAVPEVLLNGNHALIAKWRRERSIEATYKTRPELIDESSLSKKEVMFLHSLKNQDEQA